jgi:phosphate transport system protein
MVSARRRIRAEYGESATDAPVTRDLRPGFHDALAELDARIAEVFTTVASSVVDVSTAVATADRELAGRVLEREAVLDDLVLGLEHSIPTFFVCQQPVARDLRLLITAARVLPELERSQDLVSHLAERCDVTIADLPAPAVEAIWGMGRIAGHMWRDVERAYHDRDPEIARQLERRDDDLDALVVAMRDGLMAAPSPPVTLVLGAVLVGRFYERLGDHAVNLAHHVTYLVTGESGPQKSTA